MLSSGLRQLLEGLPGRLPFVVEVRDTSLALLAPQRVVSAMDSSADFRERAMSSMASGRPAVIADADRRINIFPLAGGQNHSPSGVLVIGASQVEASLVDTWAPLLHTAIQADLGAVRAVDQQVHRAHHLASVLRFVQHLCTLDSDADVLRAVLQAAAMWFDVDARVFRREPGGDFVPHMWLPGVSVEPGCRIKSAIVDMISGTRRVTSLSELDDLGVTAVETLLVPLGKRTPHMVLVLAGAMPPDAELTFGVMGVVVTLLLDQLTTHRRAALRATLTAVLSDSEASIESRLTRTLISLLAAAMATSGSIAVTMGGETRVLASIGEGATSDNPRSHPVSEAADRLALQMQIGSGVSASLEVHQGGRSFSPFAPDAVEVCRDVLGPWLAALVTNGEAPFADRSAPVGREFLDQLEREVARAGRFNLNLSLILVEFAQEAPDAALRADALALVRSEVRECDVVGALSANKLGILLIQTGEPGAAAAAQRLRSRLSVPGLGSYAAASISRAAFSPSCSTADALVEQARIAEPSQI